MVQYLIFTQTKGYPGWNIHQLLLFQGLMLVWLGIRNTAFGDLKQNIINLIWRGDFDRVLLKPYPPIGILLTSGFNFRHFGSVIAGLVVALVAAGKLNLSIGLVQIGLFILGLIFGLLLNMAIDIVFCGIVITIVQTGRLDDFFDKILYFFRYPIEIFPKVIQVTFITVIPFAIWVYFPTQVLLNRINLKILLALPISFVLFQLSLVFWKHCLKKYTSAGG